uniref:F-box only protein 9 n=1 Tax=Clastoptera arizonana TaxID=38151 RepID=A0A1B6DUW8_9HEMI
MSNLNGSISSDGGSSSHGQSGGVDEDSDDQEDSSSSNLFQQGNSDLASFRAQWQKELQYSPNVGQKLSETSIKSRKEEDDTNENKAKDLFLKGVEHEQKGKLYEAIQFYRRAVQLVPDIEFKIYESTKQKQRLDIPETEDVQECIEVLNSGEEEFNPELTDLLSHLQKIVNRTGYIFTPKIHQTETHISALPTEIIIYILRWVVSSDLDLRALEVCSLVCRGLYICSRDSEIWRLACIRIWGVNCGGLSLYNSWREMFILRPRLNFNGCYISKTSYIRHGENSFQDRFYRPWHFVQYYRYLRFFS